MTFKEALVDTLRFYGEDTSRRSHQGDDCFFLHEDGRRCAVGRFIRPEKESFFRGMDLLHNSNIEAAIHTHQLNAWVGGKRLITESEAIQELTVLNDAELQDLLFLEILHDENQNWDENGLTEFGMETVQHFRPDLVEYVRSELKDAVIA